MQGKVKVVYFRRVCKDLETKFTGGNIIKERNIWVVSLLRYSAAFINWNCIELTHLDRRNRELITMHKTLHWKGNVDHLYLPKRQGVRGLQGVKKTVKLTNLGLQNYVKESRERLRTAARSMNIDLIDPIWETIIEAKKQRKEERTISWGGAGECCIASVYEKLRK